LAAAEAVVRRFVRPYQAPGSVVAPAYPAAACDYLPFTLGPNLRFEHRTSTFSCVYETNADGFRDPDSIASNKSPDERRVLVCGDSFTLGWGVAESETFCRQSQGALNRGGHGRYRVLNAGYRAGYTLDHYYAFLVRESARWQPDHIVIAVYLGNDLDDLRDNRWDEVDASGLPTRIATRRAYPDTMGRFVDPARYDFELSPILQRSRLCVALAQLLKSRPYDSPQLDWNETIRRADRTIAGIDRHCRARGRLLTWVLLPPMHPNAQAELCRQVVLGGLDRVGAKWVRADETLRESGLPIESLFIVGDGHFTPAAHRLVGEQLADSILEQTSEHFTRQFRPLLASSSPDAEPSR
jgi:lysophospholipase L1-like esterase